MSHRIIETFTIDLRKFKDWKETFVGEYQLTEVKTVKYSLMYLSKTFSTNSSAVHVTWYIQYAVHFLASCRWHIRLLTHCCYLLTQKSCIEMTICQNNHCNFLSTISMFMIFCSSVILRNVFSLSHYTSTTPPPPLIHIKKNNKTSVLMYYLYPVYKNKSKWITTVSWGMETLMEFITPSLSNLKKIPI